jgi:pimeloyl-ACP methyl ester carboxylesterase
MSSTETRTGYAAVNGLEMYYEIHGSGEPLLLLHGAYMTVDMFGPLLEGLAAGRQVIVPELRGHGRTADVEGPITYEAMADDAAGLLTHLDLESADVVGYSMGAGAALQLAIRHPEAVRRLVVASASYAYDGMQPEMIEMVPTITPEMFAGSPMEQEYQRIAPNPDDFTTLVAKLKALDETPFDWSEGVRGLTAPTLLIVGDADVVRLEHAVEFFRLLGGGHMGDLTGPPESRLAVLPGTTHFIPPGSGMLDRSEWLLPMIRAFLDAPVPEVT